MFVNFNLNLGKVQILGYMDSLSKRVDWFTWDGFECYKDFSKTNMVTEMGIKTKDDVEYNKDWEILKEFIDEVDFKAVLLENHNRETVVEFDSIRGAIQLYINSFPFKCGEYCIWNEKEEVWGIDPTF